MAQATLTPTQAAFLVRLRAFQPEDMRKQMKSDLFNLVKDGFGIPRDHKLTVEIDSSASPVFLVLRRKKDGQAYELAADGKWVGADRAPAAPVSQLSNYRVSWEIDAPALEPRDAAQEVFDTYFTAGHSATNFKVTNTANGAVVDVDLSDY